MILNKWLVAASGLMMVDKLKKYEKIDFLGEGQVSFTHTDSVLVNVCC